jgi:hypothetical protein
MQLARSGIALDPLRFGRAGGNALCAPQAESTTGEGLRLFATTFAAGFLFVSLFIA